MQDLQERPVVDVGWRHGHGQAEAAWWAYNSHLYIYTKASIRIMLKLRGSTFLHSNITAITMSS